MLLIYNHVVVLRDGKPLFFSPPSAATETVYHKRARVRATLPRVRDRAHRSAVAESNEQDLSAAAPGAKLTENALQQLAGEASAGRVFSAFGARAPVSLCALSVSARPSAGGRRGRDVEQRRHHCRNGVAALRRAPAAARLVGGARAVCGHCEVARRPRAAVGARRARVGCDRRRRRSLCAYGYSSVPLTSVPELRTVGAKASDCLLAGLILIGRRLSHAGQTNNAALWCRSR